MQFIKEFFGFLPCTRPIEGFLSWQHILFITMFMVVMTVSAVKLGLKNKDRSDKEKTRVLIWAAILIDSFELFKIVLCCVRSGDPLNWLYDLPLFLCSIQLITIPLAAFSKGRIREAALDFVFIFGILGAVLGTYGAGNLYSSYPVLHFDPLVSAITHSISGFSSLYIAFSGMASSGESAANGWVWAAMVPSRIRSTISWDSLKMYSLISGSNALSTCFM
jgi:hypothetical protein